MAKSQTREISESYFDDMLVRLASDMRAYDEKQAELERLTDERATHAELVDAALEAEDVTFPLYVAREALSVYIIDRRMSEVGKATNLLYTAERDKLLALHTIRYKNKPITIKALGAGSISAFRTDSRDELVATGRFYDSRRGNIRDIGLNPSDGGYIQVERGFRVYQAQPLVSREDDYKAAFSLTWE